MGGFLILRRRFGFMPSLLVGAILGGVELFEPGDDTRVDDPVGGGCGGLCFSRSEPGMNKERHRWFRGQACGVEVGRNCSAVFALRPEEAGRFR